MDKVTLRKEIRAKKRAMTEEEILSRSARLGELFLASDAYKNAKIEKIPKARVNELEAQLAVHGRAFTKTVITNNGCQLSLKTEYIILDIAMYFGQVFVKNQKLIMELKNLL